MKKGRRRRQAPPQERARLPGEATPKAQRGPRRQPLSCPVDLTALSPISLALRSPPSALLPHAPSASPPPAALTPPAGLAPAPSPACAAASGALTAQLRPPRPHVASGGSQPHLRGRQVARNRRSEFSGPWIPPTPAKGLRGQKPALAGQ